MTSITLTLGSTRLCISGEGLEIEFLQSASAVAPRGCSPVTTPGADESVVKFETRSPVPGAADGQHGIPSPEAGGAKMEGHCYARPDRAGAEPGFIDANSGHAVTNPIPSASPPALTEPADVRLLPASAGNLSRNDSYIGLHRVRA